MAGILFLFIQLSFASETFTMDVSHTVKFPAEKVFACLKDARNDIHWRKEVHSIETSGPLRIGQIFLEDAKLGKHEHYFTETELIELGPGMAFYETTEGNPYYLSSLRLVEDLGNGRTKITYEVEVEKEMLWDILGFRVPLNLAMGAYASRMKRYLRKYDEIKAELPCSRPEQPY